MFRVRLTLLTLIAIAMFYWVRPTVAGDAFQIVDIDNQIAAARRDLEQAQSAYRLYANVDYPRQLHQLEREIVFTRELLESHRRRVVEYERFDRLRYSHPLFVTLENARLAETETRLRLQCLHEERTLLQRTRGEQLRMLRLQLDAASDRLSRLLVAR